MFYGKVCPWAGGYGHGKLPQCSDFGELQPFDPLDRIARNYADLRPRS